MFGDLDPAACLDQAFAQGLAEGRAQARADPLLLEQCRAQGREAGLELGYMAGLAQQVLLWPGARPGLRAQAQELQLLAEQLRLGLDHPRSVRAAELLSVLQARLGIKQPESGFQ
jgi:hypothetical protein